MSYHSSKFVVDRIDYLRQLVREKDGNSRHFANDSSEKKTRELDKLVRILRPANQQANDHTHAIRLRLRQAILNHPNAASEGPLLLSRFDKVFDSLKRLSPMLGGPVLAFLKPLSFKAIPTFTRHLPDAVEEDQRLAEDTDHRLSLTQGSSLAAPELVQAVRSTAAHQPLQLQHHAESRKPTELLPSHRNAPLFPTSPAPENSAAAANNACWVTPDVEKKLLVDLIYILQGVTGKYIRYDSQSESYLIDPSLALPVAVRDITLCICELGWLFARVSTYLKRIFAGNTDAHGLVVQAFGFAIQEELQDYYRLLAVLEQEVQRPPAATAQQQQMSTQFLAPTQENDLKFASKPTRHTDATDAAVVVAGGASMVTASNLTLLRLKAWMQEPLERMCLMARLVDGAGTLLGGALASRLHAHARHGDLQTSSFVQRLMDSVCSPLYTMCIRWILHGELQDPHHEFFIVAAAGTSATNPAKNPWRDAYFLRPQLLPCFLPRPLAEKMLNIGRSINFLKMCFQRLPKEKQQHQAYQKMMMKMTGHGARAKRSFRAMNKQKKLTTYGRVVDELDDDAATLDGGGGAGGDAAERESVVSASTMAQQTTGSGKGGALVPVHGGRHGAAVHAAGGGGGGAVTIAGTATGAHDGLGIHADEQYFLRDAFQDIHPQDIAEALRALRYAGDLPLSTFVHRLSYQIDTRLLQLLEQRFHYRQHLAALKRFLLLGQGDFVMCLMDGVGPELKKRANQLFRHNLTAILEGALRASNAQYDPPYILDRVHVRLLDAAPGDTGWEVFALDYSVDMPLHAIVHPEALQQYRVAFHMLWRLKRVEWSLTTTWKSFLSFAHSHEWKTHQLSSSKLRKLPSLVEVRSIFHRCNLHRAKMMHLVNNFSAFVMFEVLESSWVTLEKSLHQAQSLDQVIDAHDQYLHDILDKALLSPKYETLHMMIQALLQTILRFCSLEETLVADAMALVARQKMLRAAVEESLDVSAATAGARDGISASLILRIDETVRDYNQQFDELMTALKDEAEKSHDFLRYLTFRLDFNGYHVSTTTTMPPPSAAAPSATAMAAANPTTTTSSSSSSVQLGSTLANESAADRQWKQQQQSRLVSSVRPGSAVAAMTGQPSRSVAAEEGGAAGFYYNATAPGTSSRVPQHHPDVLAASTNQSTSSRFPPK